MISWFIVQCYLCESSASGLPKEELHNLLIANGGGGNGCMGGSDGD